ncbi:MAG: phosphatase PAP2 family protein [Lachnospiraceae bacterium]|nr:phosphatase PAP2 family protein [Lachnospiraceae bacterium]
METILKLDGQILLWIQNTIRSDLLTPFFKWITSLGNGGMIWIGITILLLLFPKTRKTGYMTAAALLLSLFINNFWLKNWIARIRPYETVDGLVRIIGRQKDYSFPSGHTASSLCAAVVLMRIGLYNKRLKCSKERIPHGVYFPFYAGVIAMILAVLISISRLYVGVHYPTDVLGGAITGILIGWFVVEVFQRNHWFIRNESL